MRAPWRLLLGLLCIGLVLLGGTLSATHMHAQDAQPHADCSLCIAAHTDVQISTPPAQLPVEMVFTTVDVSLPAPRVRILSRFALFTRPPPDHAPRS